MATYFPVLLWLRKERYLHENVVFPVTYAGEFACRIRGKPYTCSVVH